MVQIKFSASALFILAAAAIGPVVALPIPTNPTTDSDHVSRPSSDSEFYREDLNNHYEIPASKLEESGSKIVLAAFHPPGEKVKNVPDITPEALKKYIKTEEKREKNRDQVQVKHKDLPSQPDNRATQHAQPNAGPVPAIEVRPATPIIPPGPGSPPLSPPGSPSSSPPGSPSLSPPGSPLLSPPGSRPPSPKGSHFQAGNTLTRKASQSSVSLAQPEAGSSGSHAGASPLPNPKASTSSASLASTRSKRSLKSVISRVKSVVGLGPGGPGKKTN